MSARRTKKHCRRGVFAPGEVELAFAIVDDADRSRVKLAVKPIDKDGWHGRHVISPPEIFSSVSKLSSGEALFHLRNPHLRQRCRM